MSAASLLHSRRTLQEERNRKKHGQLVFQLGLALLLDGREVNSQVVLGHGAVP